MKRRRVVRFTRPAHRVPGIKDRFLREAVDQLREALINAQCHAVQLNDDLLEGAEEQAIRHVEALLTLALQTLDGVENLRERGG